MASHQGYMVLFGRWILIILACIVFVPELKAKDQDNFLTPLSQLDQETHPCFVSKDKGLISVVAEDIPIDTILNRLVELTGVEIVSFPLPEKISVSFENLTFENALKRLVKDYAVVFQKDPQDKSRYKIIKAYILQDQAYPNKIKPDKSNKLLTKNSSCSKNYSTFYLMKIF